VGKGAVSIYLKKPVALTHRPKAFDEGLIVTLPKKNLLPVIAGAR
jgi:hypothetical protein